MSWITENLNRHTDSNTFQHTVIYTVNGNGVIEIMSKAADSCLHSLNNNLFVLHVLDAYGIRGNVLTFKYDADPL